MYYEYILVYIDCITLISHIAKEVKDIIVKAFNIKDEKGIQAED